MRYLLILCLLLIAIISYAQPAAPAVDDPVKTLSELFKKNKAAGLEEAPRVFAAFQAKGDVDGMLRCYNPTYSGTYIGGGNLHSETLFKMESILAPMLRAAGRWEKLGDSM